MDPIAKTTINNLMESTENQDKFATAAQVDGKNTHQVDVEGTHGIDDVATHQNNPKENSKLMNDQSGFEECNLTVLSTDLAEMESIRTETDLEQDVPQATEQIANTANEIDPIEKEEEEEEDVKPKEAQIMNMEPMRSFCNTMLQNVTDELYTKTEIGNNRIKIPAIDELCNPEEKELDLQDSLNEEMKSPRVANIPNMQFQPMLFTADCDNEPQLLLNKITNREEICHQEEITNTALLMEDDFSHVAVEQVPNIRSLGPYISQMVSEFENATNMQARIRMQELQQNDPLSVPLQVPDVPQDVALQEPSIPQIISLQQTDDLQAIPLQEVQSRTHNDTCSQPLVRQLVTTQHCQELREQVTPMHNTQVNVNHVSQMQEHALHCVDAAAATELIGNGTEIAQVHPLQPAVQQTGTFEDFTSNAIQMARQKSTQQSVHQSVSITNHSVESQMTYPAEYDPSVRQLVPSGKPAELQHNVARLVHSDDNPHEEQRPSRQMVFRPDDLQAQQPSVQTTLPSAVAIPISYQIPHAVMVPTLPIHSAYGVPFKARRKKISLCGCVRLVIAAYFMVFAVYALCVYFQHFVSEDLWGAQESSHPREEEVSVLSEELPWDPYNKDVDDDSSPLWESRNDIDELEKDAEAQEKSTTGIVLLIFTGVHVLSALCLSFIVHLDYRLL